MSNKYTPEERTEAVKLAREIGNKAASERLGINIDTLYTWLAKAKSDRNSDLPPLTQEELSDDNKQLKGSLPRKSRKSRYYKRHSVFS